MNKIKMTPYARFLRKDELKNVLPRERFEMLKGEDNDLYGVVIDIKALDKIDEPKIFMEYTFGTARRIRKDVQKSLPKKKIFAIFA